MPVSSETQMPDMRNSFDLGEKKKITLVPLGATELRLTIFPDLEKRFDKKSN